ncbi:MAG TPA: exodeoxyribonuclease VII small subunit [Nocardioidaceae bacterium]|nr:exodeoxyribonuclease VII small subunit [Nocardioidaceae bacterium]
MSDDAAQPAKSYEQARDELVETVRKLEAGGTTLEDSLALWQRGEELAGICQRWLDGARAKLEQAVGSDAADDQ